MTKTLNAAAILLATAAAASALAGCKLDNRPLLARGQPVADVYAAAPGPLEPPELARLPPSEAYAYPARAYRTSQAYYGEAPSYAFDYDGGEPWAWVSDDSDWMFAEPYDDGYRYYYYEPGAAYPYFVQDAGYGYAYSPAGALIGLFDAAGALLSEDRYDAYRPRARDYWSRGYTLEQAYRIKPRREVDEAAWREREPVVADRRERWFRAASAQPVWRDAVARGWDRPRGEGARQVWREDKGGAKARERQAAAMAAPAWRGPDGGRGGKPDKAEHQARKAWRQAQGGGNGDGRGRGGDKHAFAASAPEHGANASARGDGQGQGHGGGKPDHGGSGGDKHDGGGGQPQGGGGKPDHGGGHGGGKDKH